MKTLLAALIALSGCLLFAASASDAEAGNRYRSRVSYCRPVHYHAPVYHRPVYRAPAPRYRPGCRPAYRVSYRRPAPVYRYRSYARCR